MPQTRFQNGIKSSGTFSHNGPAYVKSMVSTSATITNADIANADIVDLTVSTTFTPPAQSISLGAGTHADKTSKLKGAYLSYTYTTNTSSALTHGLTGPVIGWVPVNRTDASAILYCSNIAASTSTLTLKASSSGTFKVYAWTA